MTKYCTFKIINTLQKTKKLPHLSYFFLMDFRQSVQPIRGLRHPVANQSSTFSESLRWIYSQSYSSYKSTAALKKLKGYTAQWCGLGQQAAPCCRVVKQTHSTDSWHCARAKEICEHQQWHNTEPSVCRGWDPFPSADFKLVSLTFKGEVLMACQPFKVRP